MEIFNQIHMLIRTNFRNFSFVLGLFDNTDSFPDLYDSEIPEHADGGQLQGKLKKLASVIYARLLYCTTNS